MQSTAHIQARHHISQIVLFWIILVTLLLHGCSTSPTTVYHVGIIGGVEAFAAIADGFKAGMADAGYIEGQNIIYDVHIANFDPVSQQDVIDQFIADQVDLIFAFPTEPAVAAKAATATSIPIVFSIAGIEGNDLVESVRQPGGNISGVRYPGPDLVVKRFEFLIELHPQIKHLFIPYDPTYPNGPPALEALRPVAKSHGVTLLETPVSSIEELQTALQERAAMADPGIDAVQILPEAITQSPDGWALISAFAQEQHVPLVGSMLASADIGGVFSYCVDFTEVGALAAPIADKILTGTPAGTIPLVSPEAHLRINYRMAQNLDLTVPTGLLNQADEIIR